MTESMGPLDGTDGLREPPVREVVENGSGVIVRLAGELDLYNSDAVRNALFEAAAAAPERLVVDLSAVQFVDSTALGVLIEARTKLANRASFLLAAPGVEARRALAVSGLDGHFAVHETVDDALASTV